MNFRVAGMVASGAILVALAGCATSGSGAGVGGGPSAVDLSSTVKNMDFLAQYASTYRFGAGTPRGMTVTPDGKSVLFLRSGPRSVVQDLFEFDVATGKERTLLTAQQILSGGEEKLSAEEMARRERLRLSSRGIVSYSLSKDGTTILVPLSGKLFLVDRSTLKSREVGTLKGFPIDPRFSEDGSKIACVRDGQLCVIDVTTGEELALTVKGSPTVERGAADFIAQEELQRHEGYWFSPDGGRIAFQETDTQGLEEFTIADPVHPEQAARTWPYPRPGKKNAEVRLGIVATAPTAPKRSREPVVWAQWDHAKYPYLISVRWSENAPLTVVLSNRAQTEFVVAAVNEATGELTELVREKDAAWVEVRQSVPRWLKDGSGFLWISEASGWPELQWRGKDGSLVATLAGKDLGFRDVASIDQEKGMVYVSASTDPTQSAVWRVPLKARVAPVLETPGEGAFGVTFGRTYTTRVMSGSTSKGERFWRVIAEDGRVAGEIKSVAEAPGFMPRAEWTTVEAGGRTFRAQIIRPRDFDKGKKYPVIDSVYGGPTAKVVSKTLWGSLLNQWLADQGFIVVSIDNRGTPDRGRAWERAWKEQSGNAKGDLVEVPLADHAAAIPALAAKHPEMDGSRVGIYGWSFGGYFSAMAAMRRPDVFKAGCAGAPVCDFADYDTAYTERYLGTPQENPEGYTNSSVLTWCKDLKVPLLIIHGTADDNVYFMHSLKMTDALFRAGKTYEFLALPGFTHMVPEPEVTKSLYGRVAAFFKQSLGAPR